MQYTALAAAWATHLKSWGWFSRAIVYAEDEPPSSDYPRIAMHAQWMQNGDPAWKAQIMDTTTATASDIATLNPALGIYDQALAWCANWYHQGSGELGRAEW